jgi:hypothetical protein
MAVVLRCPACREKFKYDVAKGWPDFCPLCRTDINNYRADDDIVCPAFLSPKSKATDKVARDIMDGSETRAQLAAGMAGVPVSEMDNLKITNLNDRRDAEISAMPVNNAVSQHMDNMQRAGMPVGFGTNAADAMGRAATAHTGSDKYAGLRTRNMLQEKMRPVGQAPLPLEITNNLNYRPPV